MILLDIYNNIRKIKNKRKYINLSCIISYIIYLHDQNNTCLFPTTFVIFINNI